MSIISEEYRIVRVEDLLTPGMPEKFVEIIEGELVVMSPRGKYHNRNVLSCILMTADV